MMTGMVQDQNLEKQIEKHMGCIAGFLQLFDRHHLLASKKFHSPKRLPPSKVVDAAQSSEESAATSPVISKEYAAKPLASPSPELTKKLPVSELRSPELLPPKSPLPLPVFELKDGTRSPWKFGKEAPRLSLDSRATVDAKGSLHPREICTNYSVLTPDRCDNGDDKQRRSPGVVARLMGLEEPLPDSNPEPVKKIELRRSASESRVSRDPFQYQFIDNNFFQVKQPNQLHSVAQNAIRNKNSFSNARPVHHMDLYSFRNNHHANNAKSEQPKAFNRGVVSSPWKAPPHRKSFFDIADIFPEPKQAMEGSIHGDIERRLKMRGIDESSKDLETLKQILEALQLKGLLHSNKPSLEQRNFVYDRSFQSFESPIVVMKPSKSPGMSWRMGNDSPTSRYGVRRNSNLAGEYSPSVSVSPRRERPVIDRNVRSPTRTRSNNPSNSTVKPKPVNVETQRRAARRNGSSLPPDQTVMNRSPRNRRTSAAEIYQREKITTVATEDASSSISESTFSTSSQTDTERWKLEEYKEEGKSLLERCDKLLHSIAEMNGTEMQPSPVSVLDSFYKDESWSSSSPSIHFKDESSELEEETWSSIFTPTEPDQLEDTTAAEDGDLVYISEILMASHYLPGESDLFLLLEKQQFLRGKDTSKVSRLQRRLIFDIIDEILERNRKLPPWKAFSLTDSLTLKSSARKIWSEFQRIRERDPAADDLFEIICGVLKKDLAGDGWGGDCPVELSEAVLDIERLIFKDLIGETIRDLAVFACKSNNVSSMAPRRKWL
ncbi:hypothetical protein ACH5RR_010612 [Cinchona calisaya]|uniref:DUF4378 domain-containing protein n=1 Tax=Cinchona calisaya TaxID=153742 RepID=A0ABD3AJF6_9GENT